MKELYTHLLGRYGKEGAKELLRLSIKANSYKGQFKRTLKNQIKNRFGLKPHDLENILKYASWFTTYKSYIWHLQNWKHLSEADIDQKKNFIFFTTDKYIYVLDLNGKTRSKYPISGVDLLAIEDLTEDNYSEFIVAKGDTLFCYAVPREISLLRNAEMLCDWAEEQSSLNFTLAEKYAKEAISIYEEINDTDNLALCSEILSNINKKIIL